MTEGWRWQGTRYANEAEHSLTGALAGRNVQDFWAKTAKGAAQDDAVQKARSISDGAAFLGDAMTEILIRLVETADYKNAGTRTTLARRAGSLITASATDGELLATCQALATEGLAECGDRVQVAFDQMTFAQAIRRMSARDTPLETVARVGRGAWRLELLREEATALAAKKGVNHEAVETLLTLEVRLRSRLELPLASSDLRYERCAGLTKCEIKAAGDRVLAASSDLDALAAKLDDFPPWRSALEARHQSSLQAVEVGFADRRQALEANTGSLNDFELKAAWDTLGREREAALKTRRLALGHLDCLGLNLEKPPSIRARLSGIFTALAS